MPELKVTTAQAELHVLKARMRGGVLNKARRGELEMEPPVGLIYRSDATISIDPDQEIRAALRLVFDTFERTGSALQTVRLFRDQGLRFPRRIRSGANKGELLWGEPSHSRIIQILHNPPLCRRVRLWQHSDCTQAGWEVQPSENTPGEMAICGP